MASNNAKIITAAELTCSKFIQTAAGKTSVTQPTSRRHCFSAELMPATSVFCECNSLNLFNGKKESLNPEALSVGCLFPLIYKGMRRKLHHVQKNEQNGSSFYVLNYAEPHEHQT